MADGNGVGGPMDGMNGAGDKVERTPPPVRHPEGARSLTELRETLTSGEKRLVREAMKHIEREMIETLRQVTAGVRTSEKQGSFSTTLEVKKAGKGRLKASVGARVRTPREALELDVYLDENQQLALGLGPDESQDDEGDRLPQ